MIEEEALANAPAPEAKDDFLERAQKMADVLCEEASLDPVD